VEPPIFSFDRGVGDNREQWTVQRHTRISSERLVVSVTGPDGMRQIAEVQASGVNGQHGPRIEYKKGMRGETPVIHEVNSRSAMAGIKLMIARLIASPALPGL
jgi:hypothetical protein